MALLKTTPQQSQLGLLSGSSAIINAIITVHGFDRTSAHRGDAQTLRLHKGCNSCSASVEALLLVTIFYSNLNFLYWSFVPNDIKKNPPIQTITVVGVCSMVVKVSGEKNVDHFCLRR